MEAPKKSRVDSLDKILQSTCPVTQRLLRIPRLTLLQNQPNVLTLRECGENGCDECDLLSHGALSLLAGTSGMWTEALVFAFVMNEDDRQWLRLGLHSFGDVRTTEYPREWIDFCWDSGDLDSITSTSLGLNISNIETRPSFQPSQLHQVRAWLANCQSSHGICRSNVNPVEVPRRLVDVDQGDRSLDVSLTELNVGSEPYIALSYCWGNVVPLHTTCLNFEGHKTCIPWTSLPVLFREAVSITRSLQVRYLWIDALCIIQDDVQDWTAESRNMTSYYGNAYLTISADAAADTSHSCFPRSLPTPLAMHVDDRQMRVTISKVPTHVSMTGLVPTRRTLSCSPLSGRAWTFQERLTSARILHLGSEEMVWECPSHLWCECGKSPDIWHGRTDPSIQPFRASHHQALAGLKNLERYWQTLLGMYLVRSITYDTDRLKAIMGLARQVKSSEGAAKARVGDYILGLWSFNLQNLLLWSNLSPRGSRSAGFPSWSWASISGSWLYQPPPHQLDFTPKATILSRPGELWDVDHQRPAQPHELCIAGLTVRAKLSCDEAPVGDGSRYWELETIPWSSMDMDMQVTLDDEPKNEEEGWNPCVLCLLLGFTYVNSKRSWGIVLRPDTTEHGMYTRVGIMSASEQWFARHGEHAELRLR